MTFLTFLRRGMAMLTLASLPTLSRQAAQLALAAGIGVWGAIVLAPKPSTMPPGLTAAPPRGDTAAIARWFGATPAAVKVVMAGLITSGKRGAALLQIDNNPLQAWRVGQTVASGVTLTAVERDGVVLDVGGAIQRVAAPSPPALASPGLVRVQP